MFLFLSRYYDCFIGFTCVFMLNIKIKTGIISNLTCCIFSLFMHQNVATTLLFMVIVVFVLLPRTFLFSCFMLMKEIIHIFIYDFWENCINFQFLHHSLVGKILPPPLHRLSKVTCYFHLSIIQFIIL